MLCGCSLCGWAGKVGELNERRRCESHTCIDSADKSILFCRAPVLVALALIESGMKYEDAIQLIRQ